MQRTFYKIEEYFFFCSPPRVIYVIIKILNKFSSVLRNCLKNSKGVWHRTEYHPHYPQHVQMWVLLPQPDFFE